MKTIYIGEHDRSGIVREYLREHPLIRKAVVIGEPLDIDGIESENIPLPETIMYRTYYRLLQEINTKTLIVINECLTKRTRYDLAYNCVRKYLLQTLHALVFNYYPIRQEEEDFMTLYDFIQPNPFLKEPYRYVDKFVSVNIGECLVNVTKEEITLPSEVVEEYAQEKEAVIQQVKKNADIIPRRLLKWADKHKPKGFDRMDIIKRDMRVCVSQLGVDRYYFSEIMKFKQELENVLQKIHG